MVLRGVFTAMLTREVDIDEVVLDHTPEAPRMLSGPGVYLVLS
jgi:hypothetical protein